jgi:hypothetical protein
MSISVLPIIPLSINVSLNYAQHDAHGSAIALVLAPKNADGTGYDTTDMTTLTLTFDNNLPGIANGLYALNVAAANCVLGVGILTINLDKDVVSTVVSTVKALSGRVSLKLSDGVHDVIMGYGSWSATLKA